MKLAGCIITDQEHRVLLLHRNNGRHLQWEVPGGKVEAGEDTETTAMRETNEELGVNVEIIRKLGQCVFHQDDDELDYTWYLARIVEGEPEIKEPQTFDSMSYMSLEDMRQETLSTGAWNFLGMLVDEETNLR